MVFFADGILMESLQLRPVIKTDFLMVRASYGLKVEKLKKGHVLNSENMMANGLFSNQ